jgi:predicted homoserine dehydrogenase-like protein
MSVDHALQRLETAKAPIRVGMVGAGATGRAIALQLGTPVPGIRLVGIANRTPENAERAFRQGGFAQWARVMSSHDAENKIARGVPVLATDPAVLTRCHAIDVIVEVTGTIDFAADVVLDAFAHGKTVVMVNAELDSLLGPILKAKADEAGVVLTNTDGDEPGVAMTLIRYLRTLGLKVVAAGNIKGMVDHYRNPETQRGFAEKHDQDVRKVTSFADATKLSMETTVLANATGFPVGRRGMFGPSCGYVREVADLLPPGPMLETGIVDYVVGAAPHTGAFAVIHEENPYKKEQLAYYKLGNGPFYTFYTPYHLPHLQIASTIGRAVVHGDATVAPLGGPVCEVLSVAKRDLKAGERLDGTGGFDVYGLIDNHDAARAMNALPIGLSEGCTLLRNVAKDEVIRFEDVTGILEGLAWDLWKEQNARWPYDPQSATISTTQTELAESVS